MISERPDIARERAAAGDFDMRQRRLLHRPGDLA